MGNSPGSYATGQPKDKGPTGGALGASGGDSCGAEYVLNFELGQFDSVLVDIGGLRHFAASKSPRSGYYWRVLQLDAVDTDANLQYLEFVLTPSGSLPSTANFPAAQVSDAFKVMSNSIRIGPGHSASSLSDLTLVASQIGSFASPVQFVPLIVPPGWCIACFEVNGVVSGVAHHLTLRVLYVEIPIGVELPF